MYNLCCISNELKEQGYSFKTMTWKQFNKIRDTEGEERALFLLGERWFNNVVVTLECIEHCAREGWGYRVSSALFPCLTHPDQFNVLASENQSSVDKTIAELNHHGWVMDMLGCDRSYYNPMNIHVNCTKGELSDIAARFMSNLNKCDQSVTSRLVVENEDKGCWTVANLLEHFDIPITYDNLHDKCNPSQLQCRVHPAWGMSSCAATWGNIRPLFHYSESHPDKTNQRSHADMPTDRPCSDQYDWDIELKSKDAAIRELAMIELVQQSEEMGLYK